MRRWLVGVLFFLSGATALCYQVAWTRHLVLLFGNTSHSIALILAAYMLGLALGSEAGGRMADRSRHPIALYAIFEVAIGLYAVAFPWLVEAVRAMYLGIGVAAPPVLFLGAFGLLLVPTFLMGTTLPLLVRASVERAELTGGVVGWLYGINIVGAVVGAGGTGFWLLEAAGILGSTYWAAAVNGFIGLLGLALLRKAGNPALETSTGEEPQEATATGATPAVAKAALVAAGAAGCVGLAAEVIWTRLLIFFLQGFTFTFSAMLAMFLSGLAIGGFVFGRVARRTKHPAQVLGRLQIAIGIAAAGVLLLLSNYLGVNATLASWGGLGHLAGGAAHVPGPQPAARERGDAAAAGDPDGGRVPPGGRGVPARARGPRRAGRAAVRGQHARGGARVARGGVRADPALGRHLGGRRGRGPVARVRDRRPLDRARRAPGGLGLAGRRRGRDDRPPGRRGTGAPVHPALPPVRR